MDKKPRFFCEHCNAEVKRDARFCNRCGHFFASVKCPACGKVGSSSIFKNGCPVCGYAIGSADSNNNENTNISPKKKQNFQKDESLPFWIYAITFSFLVIVFILFLYISGLI